MARARAALGDIRGKTVQEHRRIDLVGVPDPASFKVALPDGVTLEEGPSEPGPTVAPAGREKP
jgi:hypothetical protein